MRKIPARRAGSAAAVFAAVFAAGLTVGPPGAHADDTSYLRYLTEHGYTAQYADGEPIPAVSARVLGHMICENLHTGRSVAQQLPHYPAWPQFGLMAEAAQHELCPDTLS